MAKRFTEGQMIEALRKCKGFRSKTAKALGCDYQTVQNYIDGSEKIKDAFDAIRESWIDKIEGLLFEKIEKKQLTGHELVKVLDRLAKNRGYGDNKNINLGNFEPGKPFEIKVIEHK